MSFLLHPQGICETERVGRGTRIWAFAHVLPGASIGADCNICDHYCPAINRIESTG